MLKKRKMILNDNTLLCAAGWPSWDWPVWIGNFIAGFTTWHFWSEPLSRTCKQHGREVEHQCSHGASLTERASEHTPAMQSSYCCRQPENLVVVREGRSQKRDLVVGAALGLLKADTLHKRNIK